LRHRSAPLEGPSRPPEKGRTSHSRRRGRARAAAAGEGEGEAEPRPPGFAAGEGEPESPPSGFAAGGRERDREGERKKKNGRDGKETSGNWMPGRDKVWFFSVLPLYFFKIIDGRGGVCMGWALLMGYSSKFRSTSPLFLPLFKII